MDKVLEWSKAIFTGIGAGLGFFIGEFDGFLIALLVFMAVDIITGIIKAGVNKTISSEISFKGLAKKIFIILLVGVANVLDVAVFKQPSVFRTAVIFFYLANEGLSIIENVGECGVPIPQKLKDAFESLKKGDKDNEDGFQHDGSND